MKNQICTAAVAVFVSTIVSSCNVYKPLSSPSTEAQYLEEAQKCLHDGDYACAIENYSKLPEGQSRTEKLCTANMARAGLGLSELIDVISNRASGATLMGRLANEFVPWDEDKQAAAEGAKEHCEELVQTGDSAKLNTLLRALGYLVDCSMRMAKSDRYTTEGASCVEADAPDGVIEATDISTLVNGTVSAGNPGMCTTDAVACAEDVNAISSAALNNAGLGDIGDNIAALPAALVNAGGAADAARQGLRDTTL